MENMIRTVQFLRERVDPELQAQQLLVLLLAAKHEGSTVGEIAERGGLTTSAASRGVSYWLPVGRHGKPGHGVLVAKVDPLDRRRKTVHLTPKGRRLVQDLIKVAGCNCTTVEATA